MNTYKQPFHEYNNQYEDFKKNLVRRDAPWISRIRENAFKDFQKTGFPSRKDEAWKYTNITPLVEKRFVPFTTSSPTFVNQDYIGKFSYPGLESQTLVFVDGHWASGGGGYVQSLSQAFIDKPDLVKKYWKNIEDLEVNAFAALNSAFVHDGVFIYVPKDCILKKPLHLLYIATEKSKERAVYLKNLIVLEEGSEAEVIETYASTHEGEYLHNAATSIKLHREAKLRHYRVQREGLHAFHMNNLDVSLLEKSNYSSAHITVGGGLSRSDIYVSFNGEGGKAEINGVFHPKHAQHVDYHVVVDHVVPRCTSTQLFKGMIEDEATGIFNGKIFVRKDAQSTNAHQTNKNLLLSQNAKVYSKPHLEIYADDVKCTHGSSTGQLDPQALFYMRSRGIHEKEAHKILTRAFAGEVIEKIKTTPLREVIERLVFGDD